jgi:hypothetical protein
LRIRCLLPAVLLIIMVISAACNYEKTGPKGLLEKYFSAAIKQDYETVYSCYYAAYKAKMTRKEFVRKRKEASVLQAYKILSLKQENGSARAEVQLTFGASDKLTRAEPFTITMREEMVKEGGEWKIKVW